MKAFNLLVLAVLSLALFALCLFGFLAWFEDASFLERLPWQSGYWTIAGIALAGVVYALHSVWKNRRRGSLL